MTEENTDRELLEKAAKAAGLQLRTDSEAGYIRASPDGHWWPKWDPLTDDGDAFRLAVKLDLYLFYMPQMWWKAREDYCAAAAAQDHQDQCAATRRAIVRAAANLAGDTK